MTAKRKGMAARSMPYPSNDGMPVKRRDLHVYAAEVRKQSARAIERSRYLLRDRQSAIEHVFTATHVRPMTNAERRGFEQMQKDKLVR